MNSGMASFREVKSLAFDQVPSPSGIMSIFADGVFWENKEQFEAKCAENAEHALGRLLEIRVYSESSEFHAVRDSIDEARLFSWRTVDDDDFEVVDDDVQYLDIDENAPVKRDGYHYKTMSGDYYKLPVMHARKIKIRNYLDYDEDGLIHAVDFRIVGLLGEGDV